MPPPALSAWIAELASVWSHLSLPQIRMLAVYSIGMVLAESSGLTKVAFCLCQWLNEPFANVRERLRDFYCGPQDKSGQKRRGLDVQACFPGLLAWVLRRWASNELAIAIDATTLGERFVVLTISVVYAATAIPVAWKILKADAKGSWKPHWLQLLTNFKGVVPAEMNVIVLADRGLYARWLYQSIVELGWHPYLRINSHDGQYKPIDAEGYRPLNQLLEHPGENYGQRVKLFANPKSQLDCTLMACWSSNCAEPWVIVTDLPAEQSKATWYGLRNWIERGFKHDKTGGMRWNNTRMTDPNRASILWLVMAIARFRSVQSGAAYHSSMMPDQASGPTQTSAPSQQPVPRPRNPLLTGKALRPVLSVFVTGLLACRIALLSGQIPAPGLLTPAPWPDNLPTHLSNSAHIPP